MHALIKDGKVFKYPYLLSDLKRENPDTSFPNVLSEAILLSWGVVEVVATPQPEADYSKTLIEGTPIFEANELRQTWSVVEASISEVADRISQKSREVRNQRGEKLKDSDWTQVADAPVDKAAWATYRQALRDISSQVGFPWQVQWPAQP
jgi:hypothetical protein